MKTVNFKGYKVSELNFVNKHGNKHQLQFENKLSYSVKYSNGNLCEGNLEVEAFDKEAPDKFGIKISLQGMFEFDMNVKKETIHIDTFNELYPVAKAIALTVSANSGVPPIMLPPFDIAGQSIYKFEKNI